MWREKRQQVLERDSFRCKGCEKVEGATNQEGEETLPENPREKAAREELVADIARLLDGY
jgi:predicted site-specific integrase-resolvase